MKSVGMPESKREKCKMSLEVFHHNLVVPKESLAAAKTATAEDIHFH
jgi:hypothetical protein